MLGRAQHNAVGRAALRLGVGLGSRHRLQHLEHCGQPIVGPVMKVLYQTRPSLKSPTASTLLSGDTAMPFGNEPLSITLRRIPSREYWYTAPVWSVELGPGPVPQGSVKNRLPSASKSRSLGPVIN